MLCCSYVSPAYLHRTFLDRSIWTCAMRSLHVRPTVHDLHGQRVPKKMTGTFPEFSNSCQTIFPWFEISGKGLWLFGSPTGSPVRIEESWRIDWSLSAFLLLQPVLHLPETYGNQLKIKLTPRFLTLFFSCGISSENLTGKKRCKLTTSSFPMCPIKSQDIYLAPFSVHQVQGGELAHSQVRWGCFKSPLGAPQRSCRGSKLKATGVLYQACPFRDFALMLFLQHPPLGSFSVSYSFIAVPISWNNDMNPSPCCEY